jgi:exopolyphosphatase/guanosine-5'-triphosphate,3'-diphosphate pyrophosphatase
MRVAAIDIGTNTVLLLVAQRAAREADRVVAERATITRLGEGVDRTRRLSPAAIARTNACLEAYALVVRDLGVDRLSVVGTSAMRDAGGGDEIREKVRFLFGVEARVLTGEEEARLTFRGGLSGLATKADEETFVFDVGGGSTEVVIGRQDGERAVTTFAASYDVGSVRMTERCVLHDPPSREELSNVEEAAARAFASVPAMSVARIPVGIAGTMTTLAAVSLGLVSYDGARVHGHVMTVDALREVVDRLASLTIEMRRRVPGMEPNRADVIVAGGIIALALLDRWGAAAVRVSDRGVRWGLAEELLA